MARQHAYTETLRRLSERSVTKHFDAYADVAWDDPEHRIDPEDPRWELDPESPLGSTRWYRAQPPAVRARLGLHMIVTQMRTGVDFEAVLSRGLLEFTGTLPGGAPELRYAYHELIEEGQHSLMFLEFVRRAALPVEGLGGLEALVARRVSTLGRTFPELFFLFVLGGEAPIDHVQRRELRKRDALHPLLRRVMQIHVTEEARHLCFAEQYLREHVPKLGAFRRLQLQLRIPLILAGMARQMLEPPRALVRAYGIPQAVVREAFADNPAHRRQVLEGLEPVRRLCQELGLVRPGLWRTLGIWPAHAAPPAPKPRRPVPGILGACPREWTRPLAAEAS